MGKYIFTLKSGQPNKPRASLLQHTICSKGLCMKPKDQDKTWFHCKITKWAEITRDFIQVVTELLPCYDPVTQTLDTAKHG